VQVDPSKLKLKPPGTKRLKLMCDILLSTSAFKFNLRRYILGHHAPGLHIRGVAALLQCVRCHVFSGKASLLPTSSNLL
jgi:hypothetical protein